MKDMIKNNVRLKKILSIEDRIQMTKDLVSGYFINGEYTPYYREMTKIIAFFKYCVEGLEFETKKDEEGNSVEESVYTAVTSDEELMGLYNSFYGDDLRDQLSDINTDVMDIVGFEKEKMIHSHSLIEEKLTEIFSKESRNKDAELKLMKETEKLTSAQLKQTEYTNKVTELMTPEKVAKVNELILKHGEYDPNKVMEIAVKEYFNSDLHKENLNAIIESKNKQIVNLEKYKEMYESRNIRYDKEPSK